jgi:simple sugar transport system ATP-binding protein
MSAVAEVSGVGKRFGATEALTDVSLAISANESHALVGRNGAGKSTLVGVLTGLIAADAGEVRFGGEPAPDLAHRERWRARVACVYQRSTVIPSLTVGENLFLGAHPRGRAGLVSWGALRREARALLEEWDIAIDPDAMASELTVEQRQLVEIARALRTGTRFIVLDEPTAELEAREIGRLFERVHQLKEAGVSFLYISHHLEEVYEICERVTVLRDGRKIVTDSVAELSREELVRAMVGAEEAAAPGRRRTRSVETGGPVLRVRELAVEGWCSGVSFDVHAHECVGLAGLAGSGKRQVAEAIAGIVAPAAGSVQVGDTSPRPGRVDAAIAGGIGYVPQDRHAEGFAPNLGVEENLTLSVLDRLGPAGLVEPRRRAAKARELIEMLEIVASSPQQSTAELSGGNQQKTVLGRALAAGPRVLVLVSPTAGVDIASKQALFEAIEGARDLAVLVVSDELDELSICDRVLVMFGGRVVREFASERADDDLVATIEGVGAG